MPTPEEAALAAADDAEFAAVLATLSAQQRAAVELIFGAGLTYAAAAEMLGEPIGTLKSRVHLAVGHLRARLEQHDR